jgi:two-component system NtrC family sensor kinase
VNSYHGITGCEEKMDDRESLKTRFGRLLSIPDEIEGPRRYSIIRRNFSILMLVITVAPLVLMALINYHQYQSALRQEIVEPMKVLVNKAKHSFELFLINRLATVRFIASGYSFDVLADSM